MNDTITLTLTETEIRTLIKALETEKNRIVETDPAGDHLRLEFDQVIALRNMLREAR